MNEVLFDPVRHNNWATKHLIAFCRDQNLTAEELAATGVGTFGTIIETLQHIIGSDGGYVRRLVEDPPDLAGRDQPADFDQLTAWAEENEQIWEQVLANPIEVERVIVIDNGTRETRAGIFVAQALNHANHHREQVCAILTGLGIEPPDIQAWEYAWVTGRIWDLPTTG